MLAATVVAATGCGGPIEDDELERGIEAVGATAAEGQLVALDVVEDRTKSTFVRVAARDLADDAQHEAEKLADAEAQPENAATKADAVKLAQDVDAALGELQVFPADRERARQAAEKLDELSKRAEGLTARL